MIFWPGSGDFDNYFLEMCATPPAPLGLTMMGAKAAIVLLLLQLLLF